MKFFLRITLLACVALFMACGEEETEAPTPTSEYTRRPTADYAVGRGQKEAPAVRFVETAVAAGMDHTVALLANRTVVS